SDMTASPDRAGKHDRERKKLRPCYSAAPKAVSSANGISPGSLSEHFPPPSRESEEANRSGGRAVDQIAQSLSLRPWAGKLQKSARWSWPTSSHQLPALSFSASTSQTRNTGLFISGGSLTQFGPKRTRTRNR